MIDKEQAYAIVDKLLESTTTDSQAQEAPKNEEAKQDNKVIIDLQKSYDKLAGQLDEINKRLIEKESQPTNDIPKKKLII